MKIKRELAQNQNRYLLLIALLILFSGFTLKNRCKKSSIKIYAIDWYAYTRNRITKKTITETNNIFVSKICSTDSLNILLSSLVPTKDTTYNLRMYCLISQNKKTLVNISVKNSQNKAVKDAVFYIDDVKTEVNNRNGIYKLKIEPTTKIIKAFSYSNGVLEIEYSGQKKIDFVFPNNATEVIVNENK